MEEGEKNRVKRRREQRGTAYAKSGMWYVCYSDFRVTDGQLERKRLAKQVGSVEDMTKKEARVEAKSFLAKINQPTLNRPRRISMQRRSRQQFISAWTLCHPLPPSMSALAPGPSR